MTIKHETYPIWKKYNKVVVKRWCGRHFWGPESYLYESLKGCYERKFKEERSRVIGHFLCAYTPIARCEKCGKWGDVNHTKNWGLVYPYLVDEFGILGKQRPARQRRNYAWLALEEEIDNNRVLCMGCKNKAAAHWNNVRQIAENTKLISKLKLEIRNAKKANQDCRTTA